ncbi:hypothetical protein Pint_33438 [Pistacia integerrima]|uniref:Uncharacterized protein n=1 Tax=Pistacia integerrima TaxID=434235 RepID=A0ACC0X6Y0_9ROSI|nr:hypothetical protein Pint_33438 [Pistacia integerrima]
MESRGEAVNLLKSTTINGVKVYSVVSQQRSVAAWLPPKKQRVLRKNVGILINQNNLKIWILLNKSLKIKTPSVLD